MATAGAARATYAGPPVLPGELVLRDSAGDIMARSEITPDPAWVSAAASYKQVAVLYGSKLGVRCPPGTSPAAYTTAKRPAEFRQARQQGLVAAFGKLDGLTPFLAPLLPAPLALLSTLAASATTSYLRLHAATVSAALGAVG